MKSDLVRNTVIDPKAMASDYNENRNDLKVEDFDTDLTPTRQSLSSRFKEKEVEAPKTQPAANRDTLELQEDLDLLQKGLAQKSPNKRSDAP